MATDPLQNLRVTVEAQKALLHMITTSSGSFRLSESCQSHNSSQYAVLCEDLCENHLRSP